MALAAEVDLLRLFENALSHWQELRQKLESNQPIVAGDNTQVINVPAYIRSQLQDFFQQQKQKLEPMLSARQMELYQEMLYAITALIDEHMLLRQTDITPKLWLDNLLEMNLFKSRNAGSNLIDKMQQKATSTYDLSQEEKRLCQCYIRVIWLGFAGKYHKKGKLLYELNELLIKKAELQTADLSAPHLFPQAYYCSTPNPEQKKRLAPISRWQRLLLLGLLGYLLLSLTIWTGFTWKLGKVLNETANGEYTEVSRGR